MGLEVNNMNDERVEQWGYNCFDDAVLRIVPR